MSLKREQKRLVNEEFKTKRQDLIVLLLKEHWNFLSELGYDETEALEDIRETVVGCWDLPEVKEFITERRKLALIIQEFPGLWYEINDLFKDNNFIEKLEKELWEYVEVSEDNHHSPKELMEFIGKLRNIDNKWVKTDFDDLVLDYFTKRNIHVFVLRALKTLVLRKERF